MTTHSEARFVPYSADLMFEVVADVQSYPKFLPWVKALRVLLRSAEGDNDVIVAEMVVGYRNIQERYTSRVVLDRAARVIDVKQTEGPFRHLDNHWKFTPHNDGCAVEFKIVFQFKNPVLNLVVGQVFERVVMKMADAFVKRAQVLSKQTA
ncbi:MAG TPA: type II toxin-antitoxin system RatA family toxin [Rhizomicrobium sp.]|jgi:coenzyme Q-binding protein COQ10|nr:type II toxin-antitoxin system RatA family toxin [Rhizomicrobium sp.]